MFDLRHFLCFYTKRHYKIEIMFGFRIVNCISFKFYVYNIIIMVEVAIGGACYNPTSNPQELWMILKWKSILHS